MQALIVDNNESFVSVLKEELTSAGLCPVNEWSEAIDYLTDTPSDIGRKISQTHQNGNGLILLINADLKLGERRRQAQMGIEILKYQRLSQDFYLKDNLATLQNRARDVACVVYSVQSAEQLLAAKPENLVLLSPGTRFVRLPNSFREIDLERWLKLRRPEGAVPIFASILVCRMIGMTGRIGGASGSCARSISEWREKQR